MAENASTKGSYSMVVAPVAKRSDTERPASANDPLLSQILAQLQAVAAGQRAQDEKISALSEVVASIRVTSSAPPPSLRGVSREEASRIGAEFWIIVPHQKGGKQMVPAKVRPGSQDLEGDGNIAYRVVRTDEEISTGGAMFRRPDELFRTKEEAEEAAYPRKMGASRITGKQRT